MSKAKRIEAAAKMSRMREKATAAAEKATAAAEKAQATAAAKSEAAEKAKAKAAEKTEAAKRLLADVQRLEAEAAGTGSASEDPEAAGTGSTTADPPATATVVKDERASLMAWEEAQQATQAAEETSEAAKKMREEAYRAKKSAERAAEAQKGLTAKNGAVAKRAAKETMKAAREANIWAGSVERVGKATITTVELHDLEIKHHVAAGLDVHKEKIVACVLGIAGAPEGLEIREFGTDTGDLDDMAGWLVGLGAGIAIMESTGIYWYQAFHRLREAGVNAVLCNAREIKNVKGRKTDISDARWMANIARFDLVRHCRVLPKEMEGLRQMSRLRRGYVEERTNFKNKVHKLLVMNGFNVSQIASDIFGTTSMIILDGLVKDETPATILARVECTLGYRLKCPRAKFLAALKGDMTEDLRFSLVSALQNIKRMNETLATFDSKMEARLLEKGHERKVKLLTTMPGVSKVGAMTVLLELGCDVSDFRSAEALSSWAGMCPGNNESAGKRLSGRTRHGNKNLKRALCEMGWAATRTRGCYLKDKWNSQKGRLGFKRAIVALGNKMLKMIYHMLTKDEPYKDPAVDLNELKVKRNAPRWLNELARFNLI